MNLMKIKPETFAHNLKVTAREHFSAQHKEIAFIMQRLEQSPDYQAMKAAMLSSSQDGIPAEAIAFLCARIWRSAYFSAIFQNEIGKVEAMENEVELRGSCLAPSNIDACLYAPSESWTESAELSELMKALRETRYFSCQIDSAEDSLADAGWTAPVDYTEAQQNEFQTGMRYLGAVMIRVGYLAAVAQLSLVCPSPEPSQTGTTEELVDLFRRKIHLGGLDDDAATSMGYWSYDQVEEAKNIVRQEQYPGETNEDGSYKDDAPAQEGGAR